MENPKVVPPTEQTEDEERTAAAVTLHGSPPPDTNPDSDFGDFVRASPDGGLQAVVGAYDATARIESEWSERARELQDANNRLRETLDALSRSEERFRAAQETSPDGFMVLESVRDPDSGAITDFRWTYVNEAAAHIVGRPREAFVGRFLLVEMPGNKTDGLFDAYVRVVETGEPWHNEFTYAHDGVDVYLRATAAKIGDGFVVSFADRSERRRAEVALAESETRFRTLWASAPVAVSVSRAGAHLFVNPAYLAAFGYSPDTDLTGTPILEQVAPPDRERIGDHVRRRAAGEPAPDECEVRMLRADGTGFLAEVRIASLNLPDGTASVCFLNDVTRRRWVEDQDRFLLALYDTLRPLTEPEEITLTAARLLGEHLAVDRCAYADVEADGDTMNLAGNYLRGPEIRSIVGRMRFADFGAEVLALMRANKPFVVENVDTHEPPVGDPAAYRATQIQAVICVPLHKGGKFAAAMAVHSATPRRWTDGEVQLVRLVAGRCWESIERARVARNLRESEARYRTLFESVDEGFCVIEVLFDEQGQPFDYRFLEINPAFGRHTGLTGAVGKTIREFVPDLDESWFRIYGGVVRTGEPVRFENHAPAMGRWFDVYAQRVGTPEDRRVAVLFTDITERKRAEAVLRESEAQFREIADTAPAMLWITDATHSCTFLSRGWYEYTGQTVAEAEGMGWTLATHPDDRERAGRVFLEAAERREPFRLEYRLRAADGSYRWAIDAGRPRIGSNGEFWGFIGSVIDIHDRRLAEGETERNRALLDAVLDALPVGVVIAEPDGRLVRWNRANEVLWGLPDGAAPSDTASIEGYGEWKGWWPETGRRLRAEEWGMARALLSREVVTGETVEIERFDGTGRRFIVNTAAPVLDNAGRVVAAVVAQTDVTARIESERRARFLADLSDRLHALEGGDDSDAAFGEAVRSTGEFLRTARCGVRSVDVATEIVKPGREWQRDAGVSPTPTIDYPMVGFGMVFKVEVLSGRTVAVADTDTDPRLPDTQTRAACTALGIRAFVTVPLMRDTRCVGLFSVHDDQPRAWTTGEIELLEAVAQRAWLAGENARLRREREEESRKNERIAETLQRSLLVAPDPARLVGWDVATEYQAAWDEALIGGDFHDAFPLDGEVPGAAPRTALVVGDATGKGLQAAQHTAEVKYALRAFLRENPDPATALARLNDLACAGQRLDGRAENAYVAVLVVVLDPRTGAATCASAGMEPPLILRMGSAAEEVAVTGPLTGVVPGIPYEATSFTLAEGDLLALATDGVTEARRGREFFGEEGLAAALAESASAPLATAAVTAVAQAVAFAGGKRADDMCLLLARRDRLGG